MDYKILGFSALFVGILLTLGCATIEAKKVIINLPYPVKNFKHTHTVYKLIPQQKEKKRHRYGHGHSYQDEEYDGY